MAVTNNVLNAINVFSSTSVFDSNKGSVGANDLNFIKQTTAELATEGGGIIAQSLGTNGYVKFANGLILQWGFVSGNSSSTQTFEFPIACNKVFGFFGIHKQATSTEQTSFRTEAATYSDITTTYAQVRIHTYSGGGKYVFLICMQQWGNSTSETTKTFPIAFSSACYSVLNIMNENSNRYENPYVLNVTTSSFKSGLSGVNYKMYWIAVGQQAMG